MKTDTTLLPFDTAKDSATIQFEVLKKMDINARAKMTFELSDNLRSIIESGIQQRHPDYTQNQIKLAALRLTIGDDLFDQAFGGCEVPA